MAGYKEVKCPWCGKPAYITYEENRIYALSCHHCLNSVRHRDTSFTDAVYFFEELMKLISAAGEKRVAILPGVNIGDTVYIVNHHKKRVFENTVVDFVVGWGSENRNHIETLYVGKCGSRTYYKWKFSQFGKTVFTSEAEAEDALRSRGAADARTP